MNRPDEEFIPGAGFHALTPLYDPLVALTTRDRAVKAGSSSGPRSGRGTGHRPSRPTPVCIWRRSMGRAARRSRNWRRPTGRSARASRPAARRLPRK